MGKLIWTNEELPQGSPEWLEFRSRGLGGSETACLMGEGYSTTVYSLWETKMGLREPELRTAEGQEAVDRGKELEPFARFVYERMTGRQTEQLCAIHPEHPWMRTSLDGITLDRSAILEVKCPKDAATFYKHHGKKKPSVPKWRRAQLQHQIAVMHAHFGTKRVDYFAYTPWDADRPGVIIQVEADWDYINTLIERGRIFMGYLERGERPPADPFNERGGRIIARVPQRRKDKQCSPS